MNFNQPRHNFSLRTFIVANKYYFLFLFFLVAVAYFNSLRNDFVSDDIGAIVENREIGDFSFAFKHFISFPRIFMNVVIYKLFGLNPTIFRLLNIFFHLGSVFVLFPLVSYVSNKRIGLITASLFAVHPILVESVTWISGGPYPQYTFFLLVSMFFYIYSRNRTPVYIISIIAAVLGHLSSDKAIMFPAILILLTYTYSNLKKDWKRLLPFICMGIFFIGVSLVRVQQRVDIITTKNYIDVVFHNPLISVPIAVSKYLSLIFWPDGLAFYHSEINPTTTQFLLYVLVTLVYFGITIFTYFKNRQLFFWLSYFFIVISPTLTPFGISWVVAERYVYMASIGIFFVVAYFFDQLVSHKKYKTVGYVIFIFILIALTMRTIIRNLNWRNFESLSIATAKTSPSDPKTHNNMGDLYLLRGEYLKAIEEFEIAIHLNPRYGAAFHGLASAHKNLRHDVLAVQNYEQALAINPRIWQSYQGLATIYFTKKDYAKAIGYMQKAVELEPERSVLHSNLGVMHFQSGDMDSARAEFVVALRLDPNNQKAALGVKETSNK